MFLLVLRSRICDVSARAHEHDSELWFGNMSYANRCVRPRATTGSERVSLLQDAVRVESLTVLSRFRTDFYDCLTARADALFGHCQLRRTVRWSER
ncbi:hypothetical protein QFZ49_005741 [Streptomyces turgidiscabies]|uniref:Secreted protein n=1 Tax=Streptomyces turgidiscabies TaxID=85558 RepID=A0ABU0RUV0_9ACTN|nr:hypothetical protein [Streptomyces turgidiscabies]